MEKERQLPLLEKMLLLLEGNKKTPAGNVSSVELEGGQKVLSSFEFVKEEKGSRPNVEFVPGEEVVQEEAVQGNGETVQGTGVVHQDVKRVHLA